MRDSCRTRNLAEKLLVICTVVLPIRLSLCRERLAWGVPQRATLLNAAAGRRKNTSREKSDPLEKHCPCQQLFASSKCNAQIRICTMCGDVYRSIAKVF